MDKAILLFRVELETFSNCIKLSRRPISQNIKGRMFYFIMIFKDGQSLPVFLPGEGSTLCLEEVDIHFAD